MVSQLIHGVDERKEIKTVLYGSSNRIVAFRGSFVFGVFDFTYFSESLWLFIS